MNVAIFGGTFDPVHLGHLAVARAAQRRFHLRRIYFVPADLPPHKQKQPITPYYHRYAMLVLATQGEPAFLPSLMESSHFLGRQAAAGAGANYSIDTVRRFRRELGKSDRLYFLIGIDAFLEIATWREPEALLREVEFIVASRPGYSLADVGGALPEGLRPPGRVLEAVRHSAALGDVAVGGTTIHLLPEVDSKASSTAVRAAAAGGGALGRLVPAVVAEYIRKTHLYRPAHGAGRNRGRERG